VEPSEIAAVLDDYPGIAASLVVARADDAGEVRLVAYLVANADSHLTASAVRDHLRKQLPDYMIPPSFVVLPALPLNSSGKIDRARLPVPDREKSLPESEYVAPRSMVEQKLAELIGSLLHLERVGANDNFFFLGGHSLLGTQLLTRISRTFGVDLTLLSLFDHPTVAEMSSEIEKLILQKIAADSADGEVPVMSETRARGDA
jgi:acyl carrier protein